MASAYHIGSRKIILAVVLIAALLLVAAGASMSRWVAGQMQETVKRQFNEEQLVIARNISDLIERELKVLNSEISSIAKEISTGPFSPAAFNESVQKALVRVVEKGVRHIAVIDTRSRRIYTFMPNQFWTARDFPVEDLRLSALMQNPHGDAVGVGQPQIKCVPMGLELSVLQGNDFPLMILLNVNLSWFLAPVVREARSGKTGYAWVIDHSGTFLYHPDANFIGKNAFEVRKEKNPNLSFEKINAFQKEKMLMGQQGTGSYVSGWHRGLTGRIEKLIAFHPIVISTSPLQRWSVAVVAPVSEVETAVKEGYKRQSWLQALIITIIVLAAATLIFMETRWSRVLEQKVKVRTEALKRSEERYRSLVESAEDFIFTINLDGNFQSMNSFTATFFGGSVQDFIGKPLSVLFSEAVAEKQLGLVKTVYELGQSVREEMEIKIGDNRIWINANFMPLKNEQGRVSSVLCIARDVTDNKNLERQLINAEKLASLGTLAAGVAHEINNPLGVMLGFCDLILEKTDKTDPVYEDLKIIERQGLHCKEVVENLLSFSRIKEGFSQYSELNLCLEDIINVVKHTLEMNDIVLKTKFAEKMPPVSGDSRQLQQVFLNLINNAVSAMPNGGVLEIQTTFERFRHRAGVRIKDTGIGIAPENMDRIFEPFFSTKPEGEGTGLGLFVSYGIIAKYGGTLDCESHPADGPVAGGGPRKLAGTTFTIKLPTKPWEE